MPKSAPPCSPPLTLLVIRWLKPTVSYGPAAMTAYFGAACVGGVSYFSRQQSGYGHARPSCVGSPVASHRGPHATPCPTCPGQPHPIMQSVFTDTLQRTG